MGEDSEEIFSGRDSKTLKNSQNCNESNENREKCEVKRIRQSLNENLNGLDAYIELVFLWSYPCVQIKSNFDFTFSFQERTCFLRPSAYLFVESENNAVSFFETVTNYQIIWRLKIQEWSLETTMHFHSVFLRVSTNKRTMKKANKTHLSIGQSWTLLKLNCQKILSQIERTNTKFVCSAIKKFSSHPFLLAIDTTGV